MDLSNLDRRIIYILVVLALSIPLLMKYSLKPVRMASADRFYAQVEALNNSTPGIAFVSLDFGPSTKAENAAQAEVVIEHLMRRRIPLVVFSLYQLSEPFLTKIPESVAARLNAEAEGSSWAYGTDWVNLGFRPGNALVIQNIPKTKDLVSLFKKDALGNSLSELPLFKNVRTITDIKFLAEFTGLVGVFDTYVQFFQREDYKPSFGHGCTSITIPEAYIYLDSGQIQGLLEGIAGAAWYSNLLEQAHPKRKPDSSALINTGLGIAHLVIIMLVLLGNITPAMRRILGK